MIDREERKGYPETRRATADDGESEGDGDREGP